MTNKSNLTKQYLQCVKDCFPIYKKQEKQYLKQLEIHVEEFLSFNINATYEDLVSEFGLPTTIVSEYFSVLDDEYLFKNLKQKRYIDGFIYLITVLLVLFCLWCCILAALDAIESREQRIAYETITIEEIEE